MRVSLYEMMYRYLDSIGEQLVDIGVVIPNEGPIVDELGLPVMGRTAENAGASGLWVSDHLLMVDRPASDYPFSADGKPTWRLDTDYYEALVCCAVLLAATTESRVGTGVLIASQRHVLELAKATATLDRLGAGRLDLGIGAGWNRAEMSALGFDPASRGARLDETIEALRRCWAGRPEAFEGRHVSVPPDLLLFPTPLQSGGPPILVGGTSTAALKRAAKLGDGWMGIQFMSSFDPTALATQLSRLHELAHTLRDGRAMRLVLKLHSQPGEIHDVPKVLSRLADMGFHEVIIDPPWGLGVDHASEFIQECVASQAQRAP